MVVTCDVVVTVTRISRQHAGASCTSFFRALDMQ